MTGRGHPKTNMTIKNHSAENLHIPCAGELLRRMREGDRAACGDFMLHYGDLVRLRVRDKLSTPLRRVLDSEDVLSTVTRRLDRIVCDEQLRAQTDRQLWSLVMQIAKNVVSESVRTRKKEKSTTTDAGMLEQLAAAAVDTPRTETQSATQWAFQLINDKIDRLIIQRRIAGDPHEHIAALVGLTPSAVRMRWTRILQTLQTAAGRDRNDA